MLKLLRNHLYSGKVLSKVVKEVYSCIINMFKSTLLKSLPYRIDVRQFFKQEALSIQDPWGGGGGGGGGGDGRDSVYNCAFIN